MKTAVVYVHGRGGSAEESAHYRPLFPACEVLGLSYRGATPWEAGAELREAVKAVREEYDRVLLIANSIGAYFCMCAGIEAYLTRAFFLSPVVDMEGLIGGMMRRAGVSEAELRERGVIRTASGEELSWEYLRYVRSHPIRWSVPTDILCGSGDALTPIGTMCAFARSHGAALTVMEGGEHWFHTEEQMRFLDAWLKKCMAET